LTFWRRHLNQTQEFGLELGVNPSRAPVLLEGAAAEVRQLP